MITRESFDHLIIRCPSLGGEVPFSYCRKQQGGGKPCPRLPGCWMDRKGVDMEAYLTSFFTPEELTAFFRQSPQGRMDVLLLNLERVKNMQQEQRENTHQEQQTNMQQEQREKLIAAIQEKAPEGKITCETATRLADEHQISRREMGNLLNELKIKIRGCQLGCF
ncbi:MAG: hypothetical protein AB1611_11825 [bacterium]